MARALDESGVKALDAAIQEDANAPATADKIALAPSIAAPRQAASKKPAVAVDPFGEDDEK
jgi:hypothetical protein